MAWFRTPQPLLKFHNPRTFEDLTAPVPNFRAMNLKPGEVGKFFDSVLSKRSGEAVDTVRSAHEAVIARLH
jgi:hypothetical protein